MYREDIEVERVREEVDSLLYHTDSLISYDPDDIHFYLELPQDYCMDCIVRAQTSALSIDEYETIRLIDLEDYSQEACSRQMGVARTTVQQIYDTARRKVATALVEGRTLRIEGGDYVLCDGKEHVCNCGGCRKHRCHNV
mgnify:CR=1 FL=1